MGYSFGSRTEAAAARRVRFGVLQRTEKSVPRQGNVVLRHCGNGKRDAALDAHDTVMLERKEKGG